MVQNSQQNLHGKISPGNLLTHLKLGLLIKIIKLYYLSDEINFIVSSKWKTV